MREYRNVIKIFCCLSRESTKSSCLLCHGLNWVLYPSLGSWCYFPLWLFGCSKLLALRLHPGLLHFPSHTESISHGITMPMLISIGTTMHQNHHFPGPCKQNWEAVPFSLIYSFIFLERESHYVAYGGLKLIIFLHHSPE